MYQIILIIHVLAAICLIGLVLVQQGKGATMGAAYGSGASQTVFGSRGSGSFLLKVTIGFVILFFGTSIVLNRMVVTAVKKQTEVQLPVSLPAPSKQTSAESVISPNNIPALPVGNSNIPAKNK